MTRFLTNTDAIAVLARGEIVVVPTDTVWGVAIDPWSGATPSVLANLKDRQGGERTKPIAWLVHDRGDLERYGIGVSPAIRRLADAFWPGPLTLIVRAGEAVPGAFQSEAGTIGLRWAPYRPTQILLEHLAHPLAVTSANIAGAPPPQRLEDIDATLVAHTAGILGPPANAGFVASGVASTIIDCTTALPRLLRAGEVSWSAIEETIADDGREGTLS